MASSSNRKYRCAFCSKTYERTKLASHIERVHPDMLNEDKGYTANRMVFDICNKKEPIGAGQGICRICKKPTQWNEELVRYDAYCSDKCKNEARERYKKNMIRVYGKTTLLDDIKWQEEKMLANRSISGKYRWSDGSYKTYVGSYEKKFLEFCDTVLGIKSEDLMTPGPTIYYEYEGKEHTWITDAIYLPYNLVFDIKDGGDNKNNREMTSYRNKQVQKEKFITDQGEYSYIRLTNNEFVQLLTIFAELKESYMSSDEPKPIYRIHEHTAPGAIGGMPPIPSDICVVNFQEKNTFDTVFGVTNDMTGDIITRDKITGKLRKDSVYSKLKESKDYTIYRYLGESTFPISRVYNAFRKGEVVDENFIPKLFTEFEDILTSDQLDFSTMLEAVSIDDTLEKLSTIKATVENVNNADLSLPVLDPVLYEYNKSLLQDYPNVSILECMNGYYVYNKDTNNRSRCVDSVFDIDSNMIKSTYQ